MPQKINLILIFVIFNKFDTSKGTFANIKESDSFPTDSSRKKYKLDNNALKLLNLIFIKKLTN